MDAIEAIKWLAEGEKGNHHPGVAFTLSFRPRWVKAKCDDTCCLRLRYCICHESGPFIEFVPCVAHVRDNDATRFWLTNWNRGKFYSPSDSSYWFAADGGTQSEVERYWRDSRLLEAVGASNQAEKKLSEKTFAAFNTQLLINEADRVGNKEKATSLLYEKAILQSELGAAQVESLQLLTIRAVRCCYHCVCEVEKRYGTSVTSLNSNVNALLNEEKATIDRLVDKTYKGLISMPLPEISEVKPPCLNFDCEDSANSDLEEESTAEGE